MFLFTTLLKTDQEVPNKCQPMMTMTGETKILDTGIVQCRKGEEKKGLFEKTPNLS
jgi:hypothetical protein